MRLLADCGNTSIKLALAHDGGIWSHARVEPTPQGIGAFVQPHLAALDELVCLAGSARHAAVLAAWWAGASARPLRTIGRDLAVPALGQYPGCGVDRVLAGLVAVPQEGRSVVVVDAGTATTLTAWLLAPDATPAVRFGGGLIAPGVGACSAGLSQLAPVLPMVTPSAFTVSSQQHDTRGALAAALGIGYPALVGALRDRLVADAGITRCLLTGGNAGLLLEAGVFARIDYRPTLVMEGIEEWCRRSPPAPAPPQP